MPDETLIQITSTLGIPRAELRFQFSRAGGPGGQNVNKVSSKAELRFDVARSPSLTIEDRLRILSVLNTKITTAGELIITASEYRDQARNIEACIQKFVDMLAQALARPKKRRKTRPTKGAKERRIQEKKQHSQIKRLRRVEE